MNTKSEESSMKSSILKSDQGLGRLGLGLGLCCAVLLGACGGGGGGGGSTVVVPEALVSSVTAAQVFEGAAGSTTQMDFLVTLDKPVLRSLVVDYHTESTAKVGFASTGSAIGGTSCSTPGTNFINITAAKISIPVGFNTGILSVTICGNNVFEPNETFKMVWAATGTAGGSAIGTILNDDAGGVGGTGATALLGGITAFGRDTNAATNSNDDGALGFSFSNRLHNLACTQDFVSGLTWQSPLPTASVNYAGLGAIVAAVNTQAPCGFSDWRLPTANELLSLMNAASTTGTAPNADRTGAVDAMAGRYWSSESVATASSNAWYLDASNAGATSFAAKTDSNQVRLVRGAATSAVCDNSDKRFKSFADGTIEDTIKGLMWKSCPEGNSGNACATGSAAAFTTAAQMVAQMNAANALGSTTGLGYTDWRIPTRNELASLLARSCTGNLAAPASIIPLNGPLSFASATLDADAPAARLWSVNFQDGSLGQTAISTPMHLRLVRAGQ